MSFWKRFGRKKKREEETEEEAPIEFGTEALEPRVLMSATWVDADTGDDIADSTSDDDVFMGDLGDNTAHAGDGHDVLYGADGADDLFGDKGNDVLIGGAGDDSLDGGSGDDLISGGDGADTLTGGKGSDMLYGDAGNDSLDGGSGDDLLVSGGGDDSLDGGKGDDTFRFDGAASGDVITVDGGGNQDTIDLSGYASEDITVSGNHLTVNLEDGGSFTIDHDHIESILTADGDLLDDGSGGGGGSGSGGSGALTGDWAPLADAGSDQLVEFGDPVTLDASGTLDAEGDDISYTWVQVGGPHVELSDPTAAQPTFDAPDETGELVFSLVASDGYHERVDLVTIEVADINDAPEVAADPDQIVDEGTAVILDAGVTDADGDSLTYTWVQVSGPAVELSDPTAATPTFDAPNVGEPEDVVFQLTVSDGDAETVTDVTVEIHDPHVDEVQSLTPAGFSSLSAEDAAWLTPEQIASIDNPDHFYNMSGAARAELDQEAIQAIDTSLISIGYISAEQREWLTPDQIEDLDSSQLQYVPVSHVDDITVAQIEALSNPYHFYNMSGAARAELDQDLVQAIDTSLISIGYISAEQREWLTPDQIEDLGSSQLQYVPVSHVDDITVAQIEALSNPYHFYNMSGAARAELDQDLVQALDTTLISIGYISAEQREWLTPDQIEDLDSSQLQYVPVSHAEFVTAEQTAAITNPYHFYNIPSATRAALDSDAVQGLDVTIVSIGYLTSDQRGILTDDQVQQLSYGSFHYLPAERIPDLSTEQISSIPNAQAFNNLSTAQRGALTHEQILALDDDLSGVVFAGTAQGDQLEGNTNINKLVGGEGDDTLDAGAWNDAMVAGAGDDTLVAGGGDDLLSGGSGSDTAVFVGNRSDYDIVQNEDGTYTVTDLVANRDGTDTLNSIEQLEFADRTIGIDEFDAALVGTIEAADVEGLEDSPIALDINYEPAAGSTGAEDFLLISGIPEGGTLSQGELLEDGTWRVPVPDLEGLSLTPPTDSSADLELTVSTGSVTVAFSDDFNDGDLDGWSPISLGNDTYSWSAAGGEAGEGSNSGAGFLSNNIGDDAPAVYSISADIDANTGDTYNNGIGLVFGYEDAGNYYVASWNDYSTSYDSQDNHKDLTLVQVVDGVKVVLASEDQAELPDQFNFEIQVTDQGVALLVDGEAALSTASAGPELGTFGLYTSDNDQGVAYDNVAVTDLEGATAGESTSFQVAITGVADNPDAIVQDEVGTEDSWMQLHLDTALGDADGSESITQIRITGVPEGTTLSPGINQGEGIWTVTEAQLPTVCLLPPDDFSGEMQLGLEVTATEAGGDTATSTEPFSLTFAGVSDGAVLSVEDATGAEDTAIVLDIAGSLNDTDGSESLTFTISGVPTGASLSAGVDNGDGTWSVAAADAAGLTITPPENSAADFQLSVTATATEIDGDASSTSATINVQVAATADAIDLTAADASGLQDTWIVLDLTAGLTDADGSESIDSVAISGVPEGAIINPGVDLGGGVWSVTASDLEGVSILPPEGFYGDMPLVFSATSIESDGQDAATSSTAFTVNFSDIADGALVEAADVSGLEDSWVPLDLTAALIDTDGSESISNIQVSGVPEGAFLSAGSDNGDGTWSVLPAELDTLAFLAPPDASGEVELTLEVTTLELGGDEKTTTAQFTVDVEAVADEAALEVENTSGMEDAPIALEITGALTDTDGSETLSYTIGGVPAGAVLSAGIDNGDGTWSLTAAEVSGLTLTPAANSAEDFQLQVTATTTETNGHSASLTQALDVSVDAVADGVTVTVGELHGEEDEWVSLNLDVDMIDSDGSEQITSITISGVLWGSQLNHGTDLGDGVWSLTPEDLDGLAGMGPPGASGSFALTMTIETAEAEGDTTTTVTEFAATVGEVNDAAVVDAGIDLEVSEGDTVQLHGSATDEDSTELTYTWVQTAGTPVVLSDPHATAPTFEAPEGLVNSDLTFELQVSDGELTSTDEVVVHVSADDDAPTSDAGPDQSVPEGALVELSGSGSDAEGQDLTYTWVQVSGPTVQLDNPTSQTPTFEAPNELVNTDVIFELSISDGVNVSTDTVAITVEADNDAPSANAGPDLAVEEGTAITLEGSATDPEGEGLTYTWVQVSGPPIELDDPNSQTPTLTAPEGLVNTDAVFMLVASDGEHESTDTVTVSIAADNDAPSANAGPLQLVTEGDVITLAGSGTDPEGQGLSYHWTQISGPPVELNDADSAQPSFTVPNTLSNNNVMFQLEVSDGEHTSTSNAVVLFYADNDGPTADAGADILADENSLVTLTGSGIDPENQALTYEWVQTCGTPVILSDPHAAEPTFFAPEGLTNSDVSFELRVSDGTNTSVDEVLVTIAADDDAPSAEAGIDQLVNEGDAVTLMGMGTDPEGSELSYTWIQVGGPPVELSDPFSAQPTFDAPERLANTDLQFALYVSDGTGFSADTVTITIAADDDAPVSNAGSDIYAAENEIVSLSGSVTDPEGSEVEFTWTQISGPAIVLYGDDSLTPTFQVPEGVTNTEAVFQLSASDGTSTSIDTVSVVIDADNDAPTAEAGPALWVEEGQSVTLQGSGTDPEGQDLTYTWVQTGGTPVTLDDVHSPTPTFQAPEGLVNSEATFELHVSDGVNQSIDTVAVTLHADNNAPNADAGAPLAVAEGERATLANHSSDPEGQELSYSWIQLSGPAIELDDPESATPSFTAPEGLVNSEAVFMLVASDGTSESSDTVTIQIAADNDAPSASAGLPQTANEGDVVTLAGSGSDPEGQSLTYTWTQTSGPPVTLDDANAAQPSFTVPNTLSDNSVMFQLEVSDGTSTSTSNAVVFFYADNDGPIIDAGADLNANEGESVQLSGTGFDPENEELTYTWVQTGGTPVVLDDASSTTPTFTAPEGLVNSDLTFELQVSDGTNVSTDEVHVTVAADNDAPSANAGADQVVDEAQPVTLAGSGTDPEGQDLTYTWVQVSGPPVVFDDASSASPSFDAPYLLANTELVFELQVSDGTNTSADTVSVMVNETESAPISHAGPDLAAEEGDLVTLAGSGTDHDGDELSYAWTQISGPPVLLTDPTAPDPTFVAPEGLVNTEVVFALTVSDGTFESTDTMTVFLVRDNDAPAAEAGAPMVAEEGQLVQLGGSGTDAEGEELTYAWQQISGPPVVLEGTDTQTPTFTAPEGFVNTDLVFELLVSDGTNTSADTVTVTVEADNDAPTANAGPPRFGAPGEIITIAGSGIDPEGQPLSATWIQVGGPPVEIENPEAKELVFAVPEDINQSMLTFQLVISDGENQSTDTVTVAIAGDSSDAQDGSSALPSEQPVFDVPEAQSIDLDYYNERMDAIEGDLDTVGASLDLSLSLDIGGRNFTTEVAENAEALNALDRELEAAAGAAFTDSFMPRDAQMTEDEPITEAGLTEAGMNQAEAIDQGPIEAVSPLETAPPSDTEAQSPSPTESAAPIEAATADGPQVVDPHDPSSEAIDEDILGQEKDSVGFIAGIMGALGLSRNFSQKRERDNH